MIASQVDKGASDTRARRYFQLTASVGDKGSFAVSRTYAPLTALRLSAFHFFQLNADAPDVSTGNRSARRSEILCACFSLGVWANVGFIMGGRLRITGNH